MNLAQKVVKWHKLYGRKDLPWQGIKDPYKIWLSEIMLQQTQVATVIPYYYRFINRFPNINILASSNQEEVMLYWIGLGYYARARNLHLCAKIIVSDWNGIFPLDSKDLCKLPGIGRSTAAAIVAFSYGKSEPIMDGNVKRIFTRYFGIDDETNKSTVKRYLWKLAEQQIEKTKNLNMSLYTQGIIDLGATVCTIKNPNCISCPIAKNCVAKQQNRQSELPKSKKIFKKKKQINMLAMKNKHFILLEKRPSRGIWGNLWSFPEFDNNKLMENFIQNLGIFDQKPSELTNFIHTLTHYQLHIMIYIFNIDSSLWKFNISQFPSYFWIKTEKLDCIAIPPAIKKILNRIII